MKKRYIYIFILLIVIIGSGLCYYHYEIYPYQWDEAERSFQLYIKAQHVDKNNIESIKKQRIKKLHL